MRYAVRPCLEVFSVIPQAKDFLAESEAVYQLLQSNTDGRLSEVTAFKQWSFEEIVRHLHVWNKLAYASLTDQQAFRQDFETLAHGMVGGQGLRVPEKKWLGDLAGSDLLRQWHVFCATLADTFAAADPDARVPWAGPDMSAQSSITARLMETWAHAQAIYDELGMERENGDHIKSIAELGVRTYRWTFANRQQEAPMPKPHVRLRAPSGEIWTWNEERDDELIEGDAGQFCQVVTQTRNIADTELTVSGSNANLWMSVAQCFAGPVEDPPAPGVRRANR